MKKVFATVNPMDFAWFLLGVLRTPLFTSVQSFIANCDTDTFVIVCSVATYFVYSAIKNNK